MPPINSRSRSGSATSSSKRGGRCSRGQGKMSDDTSTDDEGEMSMMEEIERAFERAFDAKFGKIEQRMLELEEKSDRVYKLVSTRGIDIKDEFNYQSGSDESMYHRSLVDLMEQNNDEIKKGTKHLESLNNKQSELITNTQELMVETTLLQKMVRTSQNKGTSITSVQQHKDKIHSDDQGSEHETSDNQMSLNTSILEVANQKFDTLNNLIEHVNEKVESLGKYSEENSNRTLKKLTSMAYAVEASTVQGKVLHENMSKRIENIGASLDKRLGQIEVDIEIAKGDHDMMFQVVNNIESTMNEVVTPCLNDILNVQKETLEKGTKFENAIEKITSNTQKTDTMDISNEQNLENLSNIMESLSKLTQDVSGMQNGIDNILNYKLTEDFVQGMCQMMIDNKTILDTFADKKSLSTWTW